MLIFMQKLLIFSERLAFWMKKMGNREKRGPLRQVCLW